MVAAISNTLRQTFPTRSDDGILCRVCPLGGKPSQDRRLSEAQIVAFRSTAKLHRDDNSTASARCIRSTRRTHVENVGRAHPERRIDPAAVYEFRAAAGANFPAGW
jgi:hypothetical protein